MRHLCLAATGMKCALPTLILVAVAMFLVGCGLAFQIPHGELGQDADPLFRIEVTTAHEHVFVSGTTTLPDGTRLWATDYADREQTISEVATPIVESGEFRADIDLTGWGQGLVGTTALFRASDAQPTEFYERYGDLGERMTGSAVRSEDGERFLQAWWTFPLATE